MRRKSLNQTIRLLSAIATAAATASAAFTLGIVAEPDAVDRCQALGSDNGSQIIDIRDAERLADGTETCAALLVSKRLLTRQQTDACRRYVADGGVLVVFGRAGEYEDTDADGKLGQADKRVWALADLCGVSMTGAEGQFHSLRIWGYSPFFLGFNKLGPLELPHVAVPAALASDVTATPFASADFEPTPTARTEDEAVYSWYAATRCTGEAAYLTVARHEGVGTVVFVAEDLLAVDQMTTWRGTLLQNLLTPLLLALATERAPPQPALTDREGNLIRNGNMENVWRVAQPAPKNAAATPYLAPAGWSYNTWGGGCYVIAGDTDTDGNHVYSATFQGDAGVAANSTCVLRYRHFLAVLQPGSDYELSYRLRCERQVRVSLWGKLSGKQSWRLHVASVPGTVAGWHHQRHAVRVSITEYGNAQPQLGFWLDFSMTGDSRLDLDDVTLRPLP